MVGMAKSMDGLKRHRRLLIFGSSICTNADYKQDWRERIISKNSFTLKTWFCGLESCLVELFLGLWGLVLSQPSEGLISYIDRHHPFGWNSSISLFFALLSLYLLGLPWTISANGEWGSSSDKGWCFLRAFLSLPIFPDLSSLHVLYSIYSSPRSCEAGSIYIPILKLRKVRHREVTCPRTGSW